MGKIESQVLLVVNTGPYPGFLQGGLHRCLICISIQDWEGLGACSPRKFLVIRCSDIASEAILGQKHSYNSYLAR